MRPLTHGLRSVLSIGTEHRDMHSFWAVFNHMKELYDARIIDKRTVIAYETFPQVPEMLRNPFFSKGGKFDEKSFFEAMATTHRSIDDIEKTMVQVPLGNPYFRMNMFEMIKYANLAEFSKQTKIPLIELDNSDVTKRMDALMDQRAKEAKSRQELEFQQEKIVRMFERERVGNMVKNVIEQTYRAPTENVIAFVGGAHLPTLQHGLGQAFEGVNYVSRHLLSGQGCFEMMQGQIADYNEAGKQCQKYLQESCEDHLKDAGCSDILQQFPLKFDFVQERSRDGEPILSEALRQEIYSAFRGPSISPKPSGDNSKSPLDSEKSGAQGSGR